MKWTKWTTCCNFMLYFFCLQVSIINILLVRCSYKSALRSISLVKFWQKKHFRMKNVRIKCGWNWHRQSISSTFYSRVFHTKVLLYESAFVLLPKPKRARKMLMKLTPTVNFINVLHAHFLYKFLAPKYRQQTRA